jgi:catechol 2,3-dioxygenase-like lactoylglutathione lyase family enzyme
VILDHVAIGVADVARSKTFYEQALAPLGIAPILEYPGAVGLGRDGMPAFWIKAGAYGGPVHVAFTAPDTATVDAFHAAALAAGGTDNGAAGMRTQYHPRYYGAFVLDPDGHNVEAVTHQASI